MAKGAEDTARRQLGANVALNGLNFRLASRSSGYKDFSNFIVVNAKNFGLTNATSVVVVCYISITEGNSILPENYRFADGRDLKTLSETGGFISVFDLAPAQDHDSFVPINSERHIDLINKARTKETSVYVFGRLYFTDIYGSEWRTKFCRRWEPWFAPPRFVPYSQYYGQDHERLKDQTLNFDLDAQPPAGA